MKNKTIAMFIAATFISVAQAQTLEESMTAYSSGDYTTALGGLKRLAEQGNSQAQTNLAWMYEKGHGVPADQQQAVMWYRKAAAQGHPLAKSALVQLSNSEPIAETKQNSERQLSEECLAQLKNNPKIQILADKMPFDVTKGQPLEVLANTSKPTTKEKAALSFLVSESEKCAELSNEWRKNNLPAAVNSLLASYRVEVVSAMADLFAGKITYGDLAKFRAKQATELKNNVDAVVHDLQAQRTAEGKQRSEAERQAQNQREAIAQQQQLAQQQQDNARRQAALQLLMNQRPYQPHQLQLYQVPIQRNQTTNCTTFGNQTSCVTR